jgi:hypothetical protein
MTKYKTYIEKKFYQTFEIHQGYMQETSGKFDTTFQGIITFTKTRTFSRLQAKAL